MKFTLICVGSGEYSKLGTRGKDFQNLMFSKKKVFTWNQVMICNFRLQNQVFREKKNFTLIQALFCRLNALNAY